MSGFFSSAVVHTALIVGTLVAVLAGGIGVFTVVRSQAFAGEALGDIGSSGGASPSCSPSALSGASSRPL